MKLSYLLDDYLLDEKTGVITGLVHPNGKVLEVDFFNHIKAAKEHPEFLTDKLKRLLLNYQEELMHVWIFCRQVRPHGY